MHLQLNNFTQKLDVGIFCGLGEEEREEKKRKKRKKRIKREKEEKKEKPHCGQKLVGWNERVS